jgi:hypothetical protein
MALSTTTQIKAFNAACVQNCSNVGTLLAIVSLYEENNHSAIHHTISF